MGGSDLEEFEVFIAGILRWLKMNCLLGETSIKMQVNYLGTRLTLPKGRVRKLVPKYIGPYKVVKAHNGASTVTLKLPQVLVAR